MASLYLEPVGCPEEVVDEGLIDVLVHTCTL